jgi:hypothetical protein
MMTNHGLSQYLRVSPIDLGLGTLRYGVSDYQF